MIWILLSKLVLSYPSKMFHQCTSNVVHLSNISSNLIDFEISCPNQHQRINLLNSTNIKRIVISEKTKNISFFCDHKNSEQSLIIYGEPDVYFENNCYFDDLEIHGYPFFHKPVGSNFMVKNVQIYGNPNYIFPYRYESLIYVNESNFIAPKRKIDNFEYVEISERVCFTDDQQFANKYCDGIINNLNTISRGIEYYFIKFSQPKTIRFSQSDLYFLHIFSEHQSTKTAITLEIPNSFSFSNNITLENIDVTFQLSTTPSLPMTVPIPIFKCINSVVTLQSNIIISPSKTILEDSTINDFTLALDTESFYFISNTQQTISITSYTEQLQEMFISNAIINSATSLTFTNIDLNLIKTKILPNVKFEFTIPDCNISIYDHSEIPISRIDDGYSLLLVDSNLVPIPDTQLLLNIQHLEIKNTNVESNFNNIYFSFRVTTSDFDPNIIIYSEKMITLHINNLSSGTASANFQITNCNLESDQELITNVYRSFESYQSTIPKLKEIKIHGKISTIGFYNIATTPEINVSHYNNGSHCEILLHNVWVHLLTNPELDYVTLENKARIFNDKIQIMQMKLPLKTFLDYTQMTPSIDYIIEIMGDTVITFRNNDFLIRDESASVAIDTSTGTSIYSRLSYRTDFGDCLFVNETTNSSNLKQIFYSINEGEYGHVRFDKFTNYIDNSSTIIWKFKAITVNSGIIPMNRIILTNSTTFINSNSKELLKLNEITLESLEISIDSHIYTDFLYLKKDNGLIVHFPSSDGLFEANNAYADPFSMVIYSYEGETKPYDNTIKNQCTKSTKKNRFIIDRLNLFLTFKKQQILLKGLIEIKSLYFESFNSTTYLLPSIYGADCVDRNNIYLNHSLVNDSEKYYYGNECIINFEYDNDILTDADFKFYPQQVDGKEARIMCEQHSEILAQANTAYTILYLPNEENHGKIITISLAQFILIGFGILIVVVALIFVIFAIVCYRYHHGTLIKVE